MSRPTFEEPDSSQILIGAQRLGDYLRSVGQGRVLSLAASLAKLDWRAFEELYTAGPGRPALSPRLMAGLIMYGIGKGVNSLRGLESLARTDLGCMWVCGGLQPDHSTIGKFILRHSEQFEGSFFLDVARLALSATHSDVTSVAGDGTVIQAAASRYRTLKREALDVKLEAARKAAKADASNATKQGEQAKYEAADLALASREDQRRQQRKPVSTLRVSTTEPEAPIQPQKNKSFAPSYKPSVLANEARVIVGHAVDPTSETRVLRQMLDMAETIDGTPVRDLLLDAGYLNEEVIETALNRDLNLLCPSASESPKKPKQFAKTDFTYDESKDLYLCPANKELKPIRNSLKEGYVQYGTESCVKCPLRSQCLRKDSTQHRTVKRYAIDEAKNALQQVMRQPKAFRQYAQRKAMVEPVFSVLWRMNARRFRRRGLTKARLEFSLYACAYNLGLAAAVFRFLWLWWHLRRLTYRLPLQTAFPISP